MGNVVRLFAAEFLDRSRRSPLVRRSPASLGLRAAASFKAGALALLALVLYGPPLARAGSFGPLPGLLARPELVLNLASVFFAWFGLFAGAWLASDQVLGPNEKLLAFPITLRDLARFRLWDATRSALSTALFLVLPVVSLSYVGAGWRAGATLLVLPTGLALLLAFFLAGMTAMLLILRPLRSLRPETVFLTLFLASVWTFVVALNLRRWDAAAGLDAAMRQGLEGLARRSLPALLARLAESTLPFPAVAGLLLASLLPLLAALLLATDRTLTAAYVTAHRRGGAEADGRGAPAVERPPRVGYGRVVRALGFLPVTHRALLTRDVLSILRRPFLLLRLLGLALPLLLLPVLGRQSVKDPAALAIHLFAAFLGLRLFLEAGAADMESGVPLRQSFPSAWRYLAARTLIVTVATSILLAPAFVAVALWAGWGAFALARALLLVGNVLVASLLLVPFSILLAGGRRGGWSGSGPEAHPAAMLLYWLIGAAGPFFFYRLDLALRGAGLLGPAGALAGTAAIAAVFVLNVLAATTCFRRAEAFAKT